MAKITIAQVRICYEKTLEAHNATLSITQAVAAATELSGMKSGSALDYVYNIKGLLSGKKYTRTMNAAATRSILDWIKEDFGREACFVAARAVLDHTKYYKELRNGGTLHGVIEAAESALSTASSVELSHADFQRDVFAALEENIDTRRARLAKANPVPIQTISSVRSFSRNPDVVAEVLSRAQGYCETCKKPAPFTTRTNRPYLEVHHRTPLSEGGDDTVQNAIALCPNCHREAHYAANWKTFRP